MQKIISILFFILFSLNLTAQTGNIEGIVKDFKTKEILIGSTIVIQGTSSGVITDINGNFSLTNLNPGIYSLKFSYISYKSYY